jgi:hypothetical protein
MYKCIQYAYEMHPGRRITFRNACNMHPSLRIPWFCRLGSMLSPESPQRAPESPQRAQRAPEGPREPPESTQTALECPREPPRPPQRVFRAQPPQNSTESQRGPESPQRGPRETPRAPEPQKVFREHHGLPESVQRVPDSPRERKVHVKCIPAAGSR